MQIVQGDSFQLPIKIKYQGNYVTPTTVDDVRIQIGYSLKSYSDNQLSFNTSTNEWIYPLTQQESLAFGRILEPIQVGIKIGDMVLYSPHENIAIDDNIIRKEW